jgi:hypothetical protein
MRKTATVFLFVIAIGALPVRAQIASEHAVSGAPMRSLTKRQSSSLGLEKGMNEFGVWGGGSFDSPTVIGTTEDARFASVGLRYGRILATGKGAAAEYIIDAVPAAVASVPQFVLFPTGSGPSNFRVERIRASIYGVGLSPVGFKFNFRGSAASSRSPARVEAFSISASRFLCQKQRGLITHSTLAAVFSSLPMHDARSCWDINFNTSLTEVGRKPIRDLTQTSSTLVFQDSSKCMSLMTLSENGATQAYF